MNQSSIEVAEYIVRTYVPQNLKVAAIKYYMEKTGTGLAEAKKAVDTIFEQYQMYGTVYSPEDHSLQARENVEAFIIREYVPSNSLIPAIKYYREQTGVGLAEAKIEVEKIFQQAKQSSLHTMMEELSADDVAFIEKKPDTAAIQKGIGIFCYIVILAIGVLMLVIAAGVVFGVPRMKMKEITEAVNEISQEERAQLLEWGYTEYVTDGNYEERIWGYDAGMFNTGKKLWVFRPASPEEKSLGILWKYGEFGFDYDYCEGLSIFYSGVVKEDVVEGEHGEIYEVVVVDMEDVVAIHGIPSWKVDVALEKAAKKALLLCIPFLFLGLPMCYIGIKGIRN